MKYRVLFLQKVKRDQILSCKEDKFLFKVQRRNCFSYKIIFHGRGWHPFTNTSTYRIKTNTCRQAIWVKKTNNISLPILHLEKAITQNKTKVILYNYVNPKRSWHAPLNTIYERKNWCCWYSAPFLVQALIVEVEWTLFWK